MVRLAGRGVGTKFYTKVRTGIEFVLKLNLEQD